MRQVTTSSRGRIEITPLGAGRDVGRSCIWVKIIPSGAGTATPTSRPDSSDPEVDAGCAGGNGQEVNTSRREAPPPCSFLLDLGAHTNPFEDDLVPDFDLLLKETTNSACGSSSCTTETGRDCRPFDLDFVFVTHAHLDHIGALPQLVRTVEEEYECAGDEVAEGSSTAEAKPKAIPILLTEPTFEAGRQTVLESMARRRRYYEEKQVEDCFQLPGGGKNCNDARQPAPSSTAVHHPPRKGTRFRFVKVEKTYSLALGSCTGNVVEITPFFAGHLIGAVMVLVKYAGMTVFYTGDFMNGSDRLLGPARVPNDVLERALSSFSGNEPTKGHDGEQCRRSSSSKKAKSSTTTSKKGKTKSERGPAVADALGESDEKLSLAELAAKIQVQPHGRVQDDRQTHYKVDVLLTESTFCTTVRASKLRCEAELVEKVQQTVAVGGKVLIPCVPGGLPELALLFCGEKGGAGDGERRDGMKMIAPRVMRENALRLITKHHAQWTRLNGKKAEGLMDAVGTFIAERGMDLEELERRIAEAAGSIVFAPGANLEPGSLSHQILKLWGRDGRNLVVIPGYCPPKTVGHRLLNWRYFERFAAEKEQEQQIDDDVEYGYEGEDSRCGPNAKRRRVCQQPAIEAEENKGKHAIANPTWSTPLDEQAINCAVEYHPFSAHTDLRGIRALIYQLLPRKVIVLHGTPAKMDHLAKIVQNYHGVESVVPGNGDCVVVEAWA